MYRNVSPPYPRLFWSRLRDCWSGPRRIEVRKVVAIVLCMLLAAPVFPQAQNAGAATGQSRPIGSAVKNTFQEVTSHLDPGGNLYVYLSTEEWVNGLSSQISQFREFVNAVPGTSGDDKQNAARLFDLLARLVKQSGIEQISGFGMSSIAVEKGFYRSRWMLHHNKGNDSGFLWSAFGRQPHTLDGLDLLPANTAFAWFSDLDLPLLWSVVNNEIVQSGIVGAKQTLRDLRAQFVALTGGDLDNALASIGNECGLVVTLDEKTVNPRLPGPAGQIPDIGFMLVCKVKNDTVFGLIDSVLKTNRLVIRTDRSDLRMRTIPSPSPMGPVQRMAIARSGDYLVFASTDTLIEAAVAVKAGKGTGLRSTAEFKKVSQGVPEQGNSFTFRSQRIAGMIARLQSNVLPSDPATNNPAQRQILTNLFGTPATAGTYQVTANTAEGWLSVGNSGQNPATTLFLLPTMAAVLITGTIAIPSLLRSRQAANESAAMANLRTIATAEAAYFSSRGNYGDMAALIQNGLLDSRFLSTVSGYDFAINISGRRYTATATPASPNSGRYGYFVTTDGVVRYSAIPTQAPAGQNGNPVQ